MQKDPSPSIEFSLIDVILPLAEMWKIVLLLPALAAAIVFLVLQFYPAQLTYHAKVHLPEQQVRTLLSEEALAATLATLPTDGFELPPASELLRGLQISLQKEDETGLTLTLPRRAASLELLGAIMGMLEPAAGRFLDEQRRKTAAAIVLSERTVENLMAASAAANAAFEAAQQTGTGDLSPASEITTAVMDTTNSLAAGRGWLYAQQLRANDLALFSAAQPFRAALKTPPLVALSGAAALFLVLAFIYVRQEIRFALSHEAGRQKLARLAQYMRIFRGRDPKRS